MKQFQIVVWWSMVAVLWPGSLAVVNWEPYLELLADVTDEPGNGDGYSVPNMPPGPSKLPSLVKNLKRLCVRGMWALYTEQNFASNSKVYPVNGDCDQDCSNSDVSSILQIIRSAKPLAVSVDDAGTFTRGCEYFKKTYFLSEDTPSTGTPCNTDMPLTDAKSLAVYTVDKHALLCKGTDSNDNSENCVCLNAAINQNFLIPDLTKFPKGREFGMETLRIKWIDSQDGCESYYSPPTPV